MPRPPKPLLSRDRIARTALDLLDRDGQAGLTMRNLAREHNVQAPSLYHHVTGQDEIIDLVHELVDSEIDTAALNDPDWRRGLQAYARSYRAAYLRHPHAVALVTRRLIRVPSVLKLFDDLAAALLRAGLPPARVMSYIAMIDYIVLGSTVDNFSRGFAAQPGTYADTYPSLARALGGTDRDAVNDDAFETCLGVILTELGTELSRAGQDQMDADDSRPGAGRKRTVEPQARPAPGAADSPRRPSSAAAHAVTPSCALMQKPAPMSSGATGRPTPAAPFPLAIAVARDETPLVSAVVLPPRDETQPGSAAVIPLRDETAACAAARPCRVCGRAIVGAATGRPRSYCSRSCRARAYRARKQAGTVPT